MRMCRVIIYESRHDEVIERAVALAEALVIGPGIASGKFSDYMGPLDSEAQLARVLGRVEDAMRAGAQCAFGGGPQSGSGSFMKPTVLRNAEESMRVAPEKVFGPVMAVNEVSRRGRSARIAMGVRNCGMSCGYGPRTSSRTKRFLGWPAFGTTELQQLSNVGRVTTVPSGDTGAQTANVDDRRVQVCILLFHRCGLYLVLHFGPPSSVCSCHAQAS
jgi:hypothetical protein